MATISKLVAKDVRPVTRAVPVPNLDLGGGADPDAEIIVKKMNIADVAFRQQLIVKHADGEKISYPKLFMAGLIAAMIDDDGERIADPDDLEALIAALDDQTYNDLYTAFEDLNPSLAIDVGEFEKKKPE